MRYLRYLALLIIFFIPAAAKHADAQVVVGIGAPPVCQWGYYNYAPYACAPYGYYGPDWFSGGIFIGAGPWYGRGYGYGYRGGYYGHAGYYGGYRGGYSGYRGGYAGGYHGSYSGGYHGGYSGGGGYSHSSGGGGFSHSSAGGGFHGGGGSHGGGGGRR